ncbi:MAG: TraB/GumN family protein [Novosphingobium sp.]
MQQVIGAALAFLLLLSGCSPPEPKAVTPALWEVNGPKGERGWLFGTIHALPEPVKWRSGQVEAALEGSNVLVLEIGNADDPTAIAKVFDRLSHTLGQPPVDQRVPAGARQPLEALMAKGRLADRHFDDVETWAVAITLSRAAASELDSAHGIDRAVMQAAAGKPVVELEGTENQLRIFDGLPENEQRDLLAGVVREANDDKLRDHLGMAWSKGDMEAIEAQTRRGILADPELHAALLVKRNNAWADKIDAMLASGKKPLVAVGAAHMAGPVGLPALLAARGYTVTRIQ